MAKILVIDDEPSERFLVGRILRKQGHDVTTGENGAAGLRAVREEAPDLVVTDIMMPVMGGVEFIRRLRADPATAHIPILAASGEINFVAVADAVLLKPYEDDALVAIVNTLLKKGRGGR